MKVSFSRLWRSVVVLLVSLQLGPVFLHADDGEIYGGTLVISGNSGGTQTLSLPSDARLQMGGLLRLGTGTQVIPSQVIFSGTPTLVLENSTGPVITTSSGATLSIGGNYVPTGNSSASVVFGSNTPFLLSSGVLTVNGLGNTLNLQAGGLSSGTLSLTVGTTPVIRTNGFAGPITVNATVGSPLSSLPVIMSSVTGASVRILQGTVSVDSSVSFLYLPAIANLVGNPLDMHFSAGVMDKFVLQMTYGEGAASLLGNEADLYLSWFDPATNTWKKAVDANSDGGATKRAVVGAYNASTDFQLGTYGVDTTSNTVWAVIDHNSTFGVANTAVQPAATAPEPSTLALTILGGSAILLRRRRKG